MINKYPPQSVQLTFRVVLICLLTTLRTRFLTSLRFRLLYLIMLRHDSRERKQRSHRFDLGN